MSNEVPTPAIGGDDTGRNQVFPLVTMNPSVIKVPTIESVATELEVTEDTKCGMGFLRTDFMQKLASKNVYIFMYGLTALILSAAGSYSNATITTIEKRFKIPSKTIGFIALGYDITQLSVSLFLNYYAGKGHRPRWLAFSVYTSVIYCFLYFLPHLLYGPGDEAFALTREYEDQYSNISTASVDTEPQKELCTPNGISLHCNEADGHTAAPIIIFMGLLVSGIGGSLFYTIGLSYMDDNVKKEVTPGQISILTLVQLLGLAIGYWIASFSLSKYIAPTLTPTIDQEDPRWLGAWWVGWILLGCLLIVSGSVLGLFPKVLPKAAARKMIATEKAKLQNLNDGLKDPEVVPEATASLSDMVATFKRLLKNPILLYNTAASVFYFFGYEPYWVFMAKYIEAQYRKSASVASLTTGTVGLAFSAAGVSLAGFVITKYKPTARQMAMWNIFVGMVSVLCIASHTFLGCPVNNTYGEVTPGGEIKTNFSCNAQCDCEYASYSPVCSSDGKSTFISACHAGCNNFTTDDAGAKTYTNCSCIPHDDAQPDVLANWTRSSFAWVDGGSAKPGPCPVECDSSFFAFVAVVCLLKFSGASGGASNFLISVRCVAERDKPVAMAFESTIISILAIMPSVVVYGYLIDSTCLVWGKSCTATGNCWLYDTESLRYMLNLSAAALLLVGVMFDIVVWRLVKNLQIFDIEEEDQPNQTTLETKSNQSGEKGEKNA